MHHAVLLHARAATTGRGRRISPSLWENKKPQPVKKKNSKQSRGERGKYDIVLSYQWTLGVATLHRLGEERVAVAVDLAAHGHARVERGPLAADRVHRAVENATLLLVAGAALSVFRAGHDHVVGARGRRGALDLVARAARRRLVTVTRTTRTVFPAIVHLLQRPTSYSG